MDLLRTALHDGVGVWACQRDSGCTVGTRHDLGVGSAGDCDAGDRVSRKSVWDSDACGEVGGADRSDGGVLKGKGILNNRTVVDFRSAAVF